MYNLFHRYNSSAKDTVLVRYWSKSSLEQKILLAHYVSELSLFDSFMFGTCDIVLVGLGTVCFASSKKTLFLYKFKSLFGSFRVWYRRHYFGKIQYSLAISMFGTEDNFFGKILYI